MLVLPFFASAALLHPSPMRLIAAFVLVMALFLLREPLIVLARQRWVWRTQHEETAPAGRFALGLGVMAIAGAAGAIPASAWPVALACGLAAAKLMAASTYLAVCNRQHSMLFQALGSIGLAGSSLAAALVSGSIPRWTWLLWVKTYLTNHTPGR